MEQNTWFVVRPGPDDLVHYGVQGQEHGKRRWQNRDGSLTPAGRIHYGYGPARGSHGQAQLEDRSGSSSGSRSNNDGPTVEGRGTSRYENSQGRTHTDRRSEYRDADDNTTTSNDSQQQRRRGSRNNRNEDTVDGTYRRVDNSGNPPEDGTYEQVGGSGGGRNRPPRGDNSSNSGSGGSGSSQRENASNREATLAKNYKNKSKLYGAEKDLTENLNKMVGKSVNKSTEKKKAKMDLSDLSDQDLRDYINRFNLEQQYKNIAVGDVATGRQKLQNVLEVAGGVLAVGASAATIASIIHELKKG